MRGGVGGKGGQQAVKLTRAGEPDWQSVVSVAWRLGSVRMQYISDGVSEGEWNNKVHKRKTGMRQIQ